MNYVAESDECYGNPYLGPTFTRIRISELSADSDQEAIEKASWCPDRLFRMSDGERVLIAERREQIQKGQKGKRGSKKVLVWLEMIKPPDNQQGSHR